MRPSRRTSDSEPSNWIMASATQCPRTSTNREEQSESTHASEEPAIGPVPSPNNKQRQPQRGHLARAPKLLDEILRRGRGGAVRWVAIGFLFSSFGLLGGFGECLGARLVQPSSHRKNTPEVTLLSGQLHIQTPCGFFSRVGFKVTPIVYRHALKARRSTVGVVLRPNVPVPLGT